MSWIELLLCAWIGWERRAAWWPLAVGAGGAAVNLAIAWQWWSEAGLALSGPAFQQRVVSLALVHIAASVLGYLLGRIARRLITGRERAPSELQSPQS